MTLRTVTKWVSVVAALSIPAFAQTPPPGNPNDWSAPPLTPSPAPAPVQNNRPPADPNAVAAGIQFHGEISGGTAGFGGAVSFGLGFNRVAILFTPSIGLASVNSFSSVFTTTLDLSVRIYLRQRTAGALVAYLRPGAGVLINFASNLVGLGGNIGFGAGGEYLLTKNLGFTAELALRLSGVSGSTITPVSVATIGSVGIMLHQ
ncbi:MAG: hypothetical protein JNM17_39480 [Archangium sp.]|nr:hypothetical protein [Archangium sp.]